ncbi:hypothetical protein [Streptomyces sp. NPDC001404]|uniref:hypothetical protein n=1 Tax=Streptomyces sp. NPDC001404 TaxID=3364571 RepID=UPI0036B88674
MADVNAVIGGTPPVPDLDLRRILRTATRVLHDDPAVRPQDTRQCTEASSILRGHLQELIPAVERQLQEPGAPPDGNRVLAAAQWCLAMEPRPGTRGIASHTELLAINVQRLAALLPGHTSGAPRAALYACIHDGSDPAAVMRRLHRLAAVHGASVAVAEYDTGPLQRPCGTRFAWRRITEQLAYGGSGSVQLLLAPTAKQIALADTARATVEGRLRSHGVAVRYLSPPDDKS